MVKKPDPIPGLPVWSWRKMGLFALATTALGFAGVALHRALPDGLFEVDWVATARRNADVLTPCFNSQDITLLRSYLAWDDALKEISPETWEEASRIPEPSLYAGQIIPPNCFAVESGRFGRVVTMWQRPYGEHGASLPAWNPNEARQ